MAIHKVTKVRKEASPMSPPHEHIVGVLTDDGAYHTVQEVVDSIERGDAWEAWVPGEPAAAIRPELACPKGWCMHRPYLTSEGGDTLAADLEKLPRG
jgi:hypothetical protein